jgi:hypothetical protein
VAFYTILTLTKSRKKASSWPTSFSQIYIQTFFAVSGRLSLITPDFKEELHKYITGIVTKQGQKSLELMACQIIFTLDWT